VKCKNIRTVFSLQLEEPQPKLNIYLSQNGSNPVLEILTIYSGSEPSRNRVVVPARQATQAGEIDSLGSFPRLLTSLKIRPRNAKSVLTNAEPEFNTFKVPKNRFK
jgi:hypothetical protein